MEELEARAAHNRDTQKRFIRDAEEDGLELLIHVSTLDNSPVGSPEGLAWGIVHTKAARVFVAPNPSRSIVLLDLSLDLSLDYVFALSVFGQPKRTVTVLDTPAQYSAGAAMFNHPEVREMVGQVCLPLHPLHDNHRELVPAKRRAAFRILKGGADE